MQLPDTTLFIFVSLFVLTTVVFSLFLRRIYQRSPLHHRHGTFLQRVLVVTLGICGVVLSFGYVITIRVQDNKELQIQEKAQLINSMLHTSINSTINKITIGTTNLACSPLTNRFFSDPSPENYTAVSAELDRYSISYGASVSYLLDTAGTTVATSNRFDRDSFLHKNFSFRPYFTNAITGKSFNYLAVSFTSGKRGIYHGAPVKNDDSTIVGVAVMGHDLCELDSLFASAPMVFLVDKNDIIFAASSEEQLLRPFFPIQDTGTSIKEFKKSCTFFNNSPVISTIENDGSVILGRSRYILTRTPLEFDGWSIINLSSDKAAIQYRHFGVLATAAFILVILIVISLIVLNRINDFSASLFLSEKRFQTIFENAPEAIIIVEISSGVIIAANPLALAMMAVTSNDPSLLNTFIRKINHSESLAIPLRPEALQGQFQLKTSDETRTLSVSSTQIQFSGKNCFACFLRDISSIIETQNALKTSERKYRELAEFLPEAVFEITTDGVITYSNRRGLEMFGMTADDIDKNLTPFDLVIPEERDKAKKIFERVMVERIHNQSEFTVRRKNGESFQALVYTTALVRDTKVTGVYGIVLDLTERIRTEQELQKKEKLEALGIMAGGIAHDFNNLLTAIWSGVSLLKLKMDITKDDRETIMKVESAIHRGKDLTGQMLTYSKGGAPVKTTTSLEVLLKETASFVISGTSVKCNFTIDDNLFTADVDSGQISQVIQNLLLNAIDAMPEGGIIELSLSNRHITGSEKIPLPPGNYIELICKDSGKGIPEKVSTRIFDPFFSTKPQGSGMGLSTAYSIIKKHSGYITYENNPDKGTSFRILLPSSDKSDNKKNLSKKPLSKGSGTILLMDDEDIILKVTSKLLNYLGYNVITAHSGEEVLKIYSESLTSNNSIDCIILDLTIPAGMGGKETMAELQKINASVKVIVSSGYSNDPIMAQYRDFGFSAGISKPYDINNLSDVIQSVINVEVHH